jgi:hypothetical protein
MGWNTKASMSVQTDRTDSSGAMGGIEMAPCQSK